MHVVSGWRTDTGKVRTSNEDNLFWNGIWIENGKAAGRYQPEAERSFYVFAVCDGMGGERYGEVASMLAMRTLAAYDTPDLGLRFPAYIEEANLAVCREMERRSVSHMGAAIAVMAVTEQRLAICNLGDCRIYRFDHEGLMQLSVDHRAEAPGIGKGVLTQHLGIPEEEFLLEPFVRNDLKPEKDSIYLLCSDGLTDSVSDDQLEEIMRNGRQGPPQQLADRLVAEALAGGGKDNVTAIVIMIR